MLCFEIRINGGPPVVAGGADISVLTAIMTYDQSRDELDVSMGGLAGSFEHLDWRRESLGIGNSVEIRVVDSASPTEPARRRDDLDLVERSKRQCYERLKKEYGD